jgi:ribonuclease H / adenosylcobalamin/alpha-ribazole phosphatase
MMTRTFIVEADGGSRGNPGPAAYGAVVRDAESGEVILELAEFIGHATNNVAEYKGAIAGIGAARELDAHAQVEVRLDSKLVVEQMSGRWKIKHPDMQQLAMQANGLLPRDQLTFTWVPRAANALADALVNEALDAGIASGSCLIRRSPLRTSDTEDVVGQAEEAYARSIIEEKRPPHVMIGWADIGTPTHTLMARHGATPLSLEKRFSGRGGFDAPLAELGIEQAKALAAEVVHHRGIDAVVSSPLLRAQQTAQVVCDAMGMEYVVDDDLAECDFGVWDGLTFREVQTGWPDQMADWLASSDVPPPQGESLEQCAMRVDAARRRIVEQYPGQNVLVVAHVTPIKVFVAKALGTGLEVVFRMELAPCSLTNLAWYPDGNASMFAFSDTAHLRDVASPHGT